ncbi:MAG: fructose-bisphosphate aldolase class I [Gammaproteobacteria bacterium]|nr:fructose-bisphosphate aldolase class I [Gammaproteobacteria bacterium]
MNLEALKKTAQAMVAGGKGILAADESHGTCNKRFEKLDIQTTEEKRREYRDCLLTTPKLSDYIGGVILFDETIRQSTLKGNVPFAKYLADNGIVPGIKVDAGAKNMAGHPNEIITEGLDGLRERLAEYYALGARFSKWRAVITIGANIPSTACLEANAHALARYASLCQEANIVPIVEPEVLIDGDHDIARSYEVTELAQRFLFAQLKAQNVALEGIILKPSMVISGKSAKNRADPKTVASETIRCLLNTTPAAVPGIAFLSGGQTDAEAAHHLSLMHNLGVSLPWHLTFSYGRALHQAAMDAWKGQATNVDAAQKVLYHRAKMNSLAAQGKYDTSLEKAA